MAGGALGVAEAPEQAERLDQSRLRWSRTALWSVTAESWPGAAKRRSIVQLDECGERRRCDDRGMSDRACHRRRRSPHGADGDDPARLPGGAVSLAIAVGSRDVGRHGCDVPVAAERLLGPQPRLRAVQGPRQPARGVARAARARSARRRSAVPVVPPPDRRRLRPRLVDRVVPGLQPVGRRRVRRQGRRPPALCRRAPAAGSRRGGQGARARPRARPRRGDDPGRRAAPARLAAVRRGLARGRGQRHADRGARRRARTSRATARSRSSSRPTRSTIRRRCSRSSRA